MRYAHITPAVVGGSELPQLDYAALTAAGIVVPEFEAGARGDFCFDLGDFRGLQARLSGHRLALAGAAPTYAAASLTQASGARNGLISDLPDGGSHTVACVVRRPANPASAAIMMGTALHFSDPGYTPAQGAFVCFSSSGDVLATIRRAAGNLFITCVTSSTIPVGAWAFVAMTQTDVGGGNVDLRLWVGSAGGAFTNTAAAVAKSITARTWSFGNAYDIVNTDRAIEMHRALTFNRALSTAELQGLYERVRVVAARRGITVA